jgi:hypothetical protein
MDSDIHLASQGVSAERLPKAKSALPATLGEKIPDADLIPC